MTRPPAGLHVELQPPSGPAYRLDSGGHADQRPQGIGWRTKRGEGFADGSFTLARRADLDYVDLNLYDHATIVGDDGTVAYEGRVGALPRSMTDTHSVTVQCAGWMAHMRDRKFVQVYVDRSLGSWQEPPLERRAALTAAGVSLAEIAWRQASGWTLDLPASLLPAKVDAELWYIPPTGVRVAGLQYRGDGNGTLTSWVQQFSGTDNLDGSVTSDHSQTLNGTVQTFTLPNSRSYLYQQTYSNNTATTPTAGTSRRLDALAVYGDHDVTLRDNASDPQGVFASDVLHHLVANYCPKLNTRGVQDTTYPIPHLAFTDPTHPYDAMLQVNAYHLWLPAVWENRTLHYAPADLTDYQWDVRLSDKGVTVDLQGDSTDQLANGICVTYQNAATGRKERITPDDTGDLADTAVENAANRAGLTVWTEIDLSFPATEDAAIQIGRAALAEFNQPKGVGTIKVRGHIRDRAGHLHPVWKVRAGDTIAITDHPNDRPRLIHETDYNHDDQSLTIGVEGALKRVDAFMDRVGTQLQIGAAAP